MKCPQDRVKSSKNNIRGQRPTSYWNGKKTTFTKKEKCCLTLPTAKKSYLKRHKNYRKPKSLQFKSTKLSTS